MVPGAFSSDFAVGSASWQPKEPTQWGVSPSSLTSPINAVVEPDRESALVGAIVLEALDLLVDCTHQRLVPRDPRYVVSEIE